MGTGGRSIYDNYIFRKHSQKCPGKHLKFGRKSPGKPLKRISFHCWPPCTVVWQMAVATTHIAEGIGMLVPLRPLRLSPTLWACGWQQLISSSGSSRTSVVPLPVTSKANYRLRSRLGTWRNSNLSDESVQSGLQLVNALLLVLLSSSILSSVNK